MNVLSLLIYLSAVTAFSSISENQQDCDVESLEVYLSDPDTTGTNIRTNPGGQVKSVIKNDPEKEIYYSFKVCQMQGDWMLVTSVFPENVSGWIHNSVVKANVMAYSKPVPIYATGSSKTRPADSISNEQSVKVLLAKGRFSRIEYFNTTDTKRTGFILNGNLCGSPYTNCN